MCKKKKGFTLIETLVSMILVLWVVLTAGMLLCSALKGYRNSRAAFKIMVETEYLKNRFLSYPFDSKHWLEGNYMEEGNPYKKNWSVKNISPTLKIIHLSLVDKGRGKNERIWFYKSSTINSEPLPEPGNGGNHD